MTSPVLVVTGTGTGIGKTVASTGLVRAWATRGLAVAGLKPIESGVSADSGPGDVGALDAVSTFHVTHSPAPYLLEAPVSPHLAARTEGRRIELNEVVRWLAPIRRDAQAVVLELPGGLYSPLTDDGLTNADLLVAINPTKVLLVAPDRLGVLHDVLSATRASRSQGIGIDAIVLSAPATPDASTGTNAAELARILPDVPVVASLPRAPRKVIDSHLLPALARLGL